MRREHTTEGGDVTYKLLDGVLDILLLGECGGLRVEGQSCCEAGKRQEVLLFVSDGSTWLGGEDVPAVAAVGRPSGRDGRRNGRARCRLQKPSPSAMRCAEVRSLPTPAPGGRPAAPVGASTPPATTFTCLPECLPGTWTARSDSLKPEAACSSP